MARRSGVERGLPRYIGGRGAGGADAGAERARSPPGGRLNMRRKLVAGNWKMVANRDGLAELAAVNDVAGRLDIDVAICPPFPLIGLALEAAPRLGVGGQDCHHLREG